MSETPGRAPGDDERRGDEQRDDDTRPLGWGQPDTPSGWDSPGARPQSWDSPTTSSPSASGWDQPSYAPQPQQPYGQQGGSPYGTPYGQAPGQPGGWVPYGAPVADHPRANLALVLGIVGLVLGFSCGVGFLLSPVAWGIGGSALREIRASGGHYGGEGQARAGQVMGIIGTVLLALAVLAVVAFVVFVVVLGTSSGPTDYGNV